MSSAAHQQDRSATTETFEGVLSFVFAAIPWLFGAISITYLVGIHQAIVEHGSSASHPFAVLGLDRSNAIWGLQYADSNAAVTALGQAVILALAMVLTLLNWVGARRLGALLLSAWCGLWLTQLALISQTESMGVATAGVIFAGLLTASSLINLRRLFRVA